MVAGPRRYVIYFAPELYSKKLILNIFKRKIIIRLVKIIGGSFFKYLKCVMVREM